MFHTGLSKEFPNVPFIRDNNNNEHPIIFQKELTGRDCCKFMRHIGLESIIAGISNTVIDFNVVIQSLFTKSETNICFHTWALRKLSKNIHTIPNDKNTNMQSKLSYTIFSLAPICSSSNNLTFIETEIKLYKKYDMVGFYPLNSCKFVLGNSDCPFYVLVSIVKSGTVSTFDETTNTLIKKNFEKTAVTLHVLVNAKHGNVKMKNIFEYLAGSFKLNIGNDDNDDTNVDIKN